MDRVRFVRARQAARRVAEIVAGDAGHGWTSAIRRPIQAIAGTAMLLPSAL
jgi:hypothetical protein